jgi:hypothetical protein
MPDLAELQARYKDKGLTCIGFTNQDPKNTAEKAAAFVKKRGPKLRYTFAYAEDNTTWDTWMTAAGRTAIPCSFVVDKSGRIAYIGDPTYLGVVLPMVVDRNMNASAIRGEMEKIVQEWSAVSEALNAGLESGQPRAGLKALKEFETKYPPMANNVIIVRVKLSLLPKVGEVDETKKVAEAVMAKAIEQDNPSSLAQVAALLRRGPGKESKELLSVAVKAAEEAVRIAGDKDAHALIDLAETYFVAGNKAKAKDYARMAVTVSAGESDETRQYIEKEARKLQE